MDNRLREGRIGPQRLTQQQHWLTVYPYLPQAHVAMTAAKTYLGLLTGVAS